MKKSENRTHRTTPPVATVAVAYTPPQPVGACMNEFYQLFGMNTILMTTLLSLVWLTSVFIEGPTSKFTSILNTLLIIHVITLTTQ